METKPTTSILLDARTGPGTYADVIAVAAYHADQYGSAANALAVMARQSVLYHEGARAILAAPSRGRTGSV